MARTEIGGGIVASGAGPVCGVSPNDTGVAWQMKVSPGRALVTFRGMRSRSAVALRKVQAKEPADCAPSERLPAVNGVTFRVTL